MKFKNAIEISEKIYRLLEKVRLEKRFDFDTFFDNYFPEIVPRLQNSIKNEKIAICSTNGKKTTLNFLNQIIRADEKNYITNLADNKRHPLLMSLILDIAPTNKIFNEEYQKDFFTAAFEDFELSKAFNMLNFDYLLLGNLFSSQTDFSSLFEKKKKIQNAIILNSKLNLVVNADEPFFFEIDDIKNDTTMSKKRNKFYFGFDEIEICDNQNNLIQKSDLIKCPNCGCELGYKKRFYSHLGIYNCECGFRRPKPNLSAKAQIFSDYSFLSVFYNNNKMVFKVPMGGTYNAYNALSAIALAICLKIDRRTITSSFEKHQNLKAKDEIVLHKNKKIKIKTIKNPTSLSEAVQELFAFKNKKVVFCFNSDEIDGLDTSWIWDANLNSLQGFENKIYVTGKRFDDMALRLKYAGVNPSLIIMDNSIKNAIRTCYYALDKNEEMVVLTVPSLTDEVYGVIRRV